MIQHPAPQLPLGGGQIPEHVQNRDSALRDLSVPASLMLRRSIVSCYGSLVLGVIAQVNPSVDALSFLSAARSYGRACC